MPIHEATCPYCGAELAFESPLEQIFIARRTCPEAEENSHQRREGRKEPEPVRANDPAKGESP